MRNRALLGLGVGLAALLLGGAGWVAWNSQDLEAVEDADLRVDLTEPEGAVDALTHLAEATRLLMWPEERGDEIMDALNGDLDALVGVKDVVAPNAAALAALEKALAAPAFEVPLLAALEDDQPELVLWERLGQVLSLRALQMEKTLGLEDLFLALEFGRRVETASGGNLLHTMTGLEIRRNALTAFHTWIEMTPLARGESHSIARRLEGYDTDAAAWSRTWNAEYLALKSTLESRGDAPLGAASPGLLPRAFAYQPNRTLNEFADRYRRQASNGGRLCSRLVPLETPGLDDGRLAWLPAPNREGEALLDAATPNLERFQYRRCAADTMVSALQAMAGIRAYWDEHRDLPETLDELVPDYLDVVPTDPFDGEALRWNLDHAWVYSVGDDFLDERGRIGLVVDDLSEPTFRFLFCAGPFGERQRWSREVSRAVRRPKSRS